MRRGLAWGLVGTGLAFLLAAGLMVGEGGTGGTGSSAMAVAAAAVGTGLALRRTADAPARPAPESWQVGVGVAGERPLPASGGKLARALGRMEARELLASPWVGVGIGLSMLELVMFGWWWASDFDEPWFAVLGALPMMVHPLVGMAIVAAHRAVTRPRRDGCDELFSACPAGEGVRTAGVLCTAVPVAVLATGFALALVGGVAVRSNAFGPTGDGGALVATAGVLGAGGVALGVALARWAPVFVAPVLAIVAVGLVDAQLHGIGGDRYATDRYLATFDAGEHADPLLLDLPVGGRLVWFAGLTVAVAGLALLGRARAGLPMLAGGLAVAVVGAAVAVAPMSGTDRLASRITDPASVEACVPVPAPARDVLTAGSSAAVQVCLPAEYRAAAALHADALADVVAALPAAGRAAVDGAVLRWWFDADELAHLPAELAAELPAGWRPPDDGSIPVPASTHRTSLDASRYRVAAHALALPVRPDDRGATTSVAGRADGVAVLWLGGYGLSAGRRAALLEVDEHALADGDVTVSGELWPDPCTGGPAPLVWSPTDAEAARRLLAVDDAVVLAALHDRWGELAELTTDELLALVGVEPVGLPVAVEERPHVCSW